jgi:hypothetical protein
MYISKVEDLHGHRDRYSTLLALPDPLKDLSCRLKLGGGGGSSKLCGSESVIRAVSHIHMRSHWFRNNHLSRFHNCLNSVFLALEKYS